MRSGGGDDDDSDDDDDDMERSRATIEKDDEFCHSELSAEHRVRELANAEVSV